MRPNPPRRRRGASREIETDREASSRPRDPRNPRLILRISFLLLTTDCTDFTDSVSFHPCHPRNPRLILRRSFDVDGDGQLELGSSYIFRPASAAQAMDN